MSSSTYNIAQAKTSKIVSSRGFYELDHTYDKGGPPLLAVQKITLPKEIDNKIMKCSP
jgi:hypothetical protein